MFGKAGRAESSTDPAPFSMMETVIVLKPHDQWPKRDALVLELGARLDAERSCAASGRTIKTTQELIYGRAA